jgi:Na+-transporting NADH:ubiquinone oxidoreductase subunit B
MVMKGFRKFLDNQEKYFRKGGPLEKLYPLFDATDSFLFSTGRVTERLTHVRDVISLKRVMICVVVSLVPAVLMALYNTGMQANLVLETLRQTSIAGWRGEVLSALGVELTSEGILSCMLHGALYFLPLYIVTLAVGGVWEALFASVRKQEISEGFLVTSLLFPLTLPPAMPLWQAALGISFGVVFGKEIFGGTGRNIFNPALTGRVFLFFAYPAEISGDAVWVAVDGITKATPLLEAADPGMTLSVSWVEAFIGTIPGSMGETSVLACLIGAAVLIVTGIASWRIMLSVVIGMFCLSSLLYMIGSTTNPMFQVSPLWHLVLGGFAFGTVYMTTDPVSGAMTDSGKYVYGFLIGVLTVMIRSINPAFPEGIMLAILFCNMFAPIIDRVFLNANIRRRMARSGD